jgi:hypothetical protein
MIWIVKAEYVADYRIHVTFNNDESGIIDLKEAICHDNRPIFKELIDTNKFRQFKVDFDTIVWENGLDLAPKYLYDFLKQSLHVM